MRAAGPPAPKQLLNCRQVRAYTHMQHTETQLSWSVREFQNHVGRGRQDRQYVQVWADTAGVTKQVQWWQLLVLPSTVKTTPMQR